MSRCRFNILDRASGVRYDLPGCYGGAEYGPAGCTCASGRSREDLEERVEALETLVRELTAA